MDPGSHTDYLCRQDQHNVGEDYGNDIMDILV